MRVRFVYGSVCVCKSVCVSVCRCMKVCRRVSLYSERESKTKTSSGERERTSKLPGYKSRTTL